MPSVPVDQRSPGPSPAAPSPAAPTAGAQDIELPLLELSDGVPAPAADPNALAAAAAALAAGHGPIAVDTERASGYRYGNAAYLLQFRRAGAGTHLVDPTTCGDLTALVAAVGDREWILHAASQDLPCLLELGLAPSAIFDTELAGRILNLHRVGLAAMTEEILGQRMAKAHSGEDWSTRPLPGPWLRYAALDVEPLIDLRAALADRLVAAGKDQWAAQEFAAVLHASAQPTAPQPERWRRTSGLHRVRTRRGLAVVRELWLARDAAAARTDVAPGRIISDAALVAAGEAVPRSGAALLGLTGFNGRGRNQHREAWIAAIAAAWALPDSRCPPMDRADPGPPPARAWRRRDPRAADRLDRARAVLGGIAAQHDLPTETLLAPVVVRDLMWQPPPSPDSVADALRASGARAWQVELTASALAGVLADS